MQTVSALAAASGTSMTDAAATALLPGDEVELRYPDRPDMNQSLRIRPDGKVTLPLAGEISIGGSSPADAERLIDQRYRDALLDNARRPISERRYLIHAGDEIEVRFITRPELSETIKVRPDGRITLPLVNTLIAEGKSPEDLADELRSLYAQHVRTNDFTLMMRSTTSSVYRLGDRDVRSDLSLYLPIVSIRSNQLRQIFVGGEVLRPGVISYRPNLTLLQAILEAGGQKPTAQMGSVLVLRKSDDQALAIRRDLRADLTQNATNDIVLSPSDVVVIPKTASANLAEALEQSVFNILPPLRNSAFSFIYNLTPNSRTTVETLP